MKKNLENDHERLISLASFKLRVSLWDKPQTFACMNKRTTQRKIPGKIFMFKSMISMKIVQHEHMEKKQRDS